MEERIICDNIKGRALTETTFLRNQKSKIKNQKSEIRNEG